MESKTKSVVHEPIQEFSSGGGGGVGGPGQSDKKKRISSTFSQTCKKEKKYNISDITL